MMRMIGHRVAHAAIALIAFSRAFAYSDWLTPSVDSPGPLFMSDDGDFLWVYVVIWLIVGCLALWDFRKPRSGWGIPAFIGVLTVWSWSYFGAFWVYGGEDEPWLTGFLYLGAALLTLGAHFKIAFLERKVRELSTRERVVTGVVSEVVSKIDEHQATHADIELDSPVDTDAVRSAVRRPETKGDRGGRGVS